MLWKSVLGAILRLLCETLKSDGSVPIGTSRLFKRSVSKLAPRILLHIFTSVSVYALRLAVEPVEIVAVDLVLVDAYLPSVLYNGVAAVYAFEHCQQISAYAFEIGLLATQIVLIFPKHRYYLIVCTHCAVTVNEIGEHFLCFAVFELDRLILRKNAKVPEASDAQLSTSVFRNTKA